MRILSISLSISKLTNTFSTLHLHFLSVLCTFWVIPPEITCQPQVESDLKLPWGAATWLHLGHFFGFFSCNMVA